MQMTMNRQIAAHEICDRAMDLGVDPGVSGRNSRPFVERMCGLSEWLNIYESNSRVPLPDYSQPHYERI
jgi:hypothetical protein